MADAASGSNAAAAAVAAPAKKSPSEFLKGVIGRPVTVRLNSGVDYKGILVCLDGFMNIALEQTEEWAGGVLRSKYGDCFIRGNNVMYVSAVKRKGA